MTTGSSNHNAKATHYETLGLPRDATHDAIKSAFRELSLKFHPDLNQEHSCGEAFKAVSGAHSVLADPVARKNYDRLLAEDSWWREGAGANRAGRRTRAPPPRPKSHGFLGTLANPRYFRFGLAGLGGALVVGSVLGTISSKRPDYECHHCEPLVEAWKNPSTGRYEQPAPWDKEYQKIKPKLQMVPREKVWKRRM